MLFLLLMLFGGNRRNMGAPAEGRALPNAKEALQMAATFLLAVLGWTIFRAQSVGEAFSWLKAMFNPLSFAALHGLPRELGLAAGGTVAMLSVEWIARCRGHALENMPRRRTVRWAVYYLLVWLCVFMTPGSQSFIYFRF